MLNKFTFRPSTYSTFAMFGNPGKEMVPFPFTIFLSLKNLKERSVSSHVSWTTTIKVPQTRVHNLKCRFHHEAHLMLSWLISRNDVFSHLPFTNKAFNFHFSQTNSLVHFHFETVLFVLCHAKIFLNNHHHRFQITFRLAFSNTLKQVEIRKTRSIQKQRFL